MAWPMPEEAPVMTATLPARRLGTANLAGERSVGSFGRFSGLVLMGDWMRRRPRARAGADAGFSTSLRSGPNDKARW